MLIERRGSQRLMNQINVVPYIDVMLVLLVIFMVTAPLINPGQIELPSIGKTSDPPLQPMEVSVRTDGTLWLRDRARSMRGAQGLAQPADRGDPPEAEAEPRAGGRDRRRQGRALRGGAGSHGHAAAEPGAQGGAPRQAALRPNDGRSSYETRNEKAISGALALVMHLLFFALLVFGVAWQKHEPAAMVAELWSNLPAPPLPKVEPMPPKPQPKAEAKPVPKVEPKPAPKPSPSPTSRCGRRRRKSARRRNGSLPKRKSARSRRGWRR